MKSRGSVAPHVIDDLAEAFEQCGHSTLIVDFEARGFYSASGSAAEASVAAGLLSSLKGFSPDCAISYGFGGVISLDGGAANLFELLKIPYLLLFYDAPTDQGEALQRLRGSALLRVHCWDRRHLPWLEAQGVERLFFQPLGTNVRVFGAARPSAAFASDVSFVGSLPKGALKRGLPGNQPLQAFARSAVALKLFEPCKPFEEIVDAVESSLSGEALASFSSFRSSKGFVRFRLDLMAYADALYRRESMRALKDLRPVVYGGGAWFESGLEGVELKGPVAYGSELASLYASSAVNVNLTNSHLEGAVNQRPFDCAAAGAFALSDFREQLPELFDPETEMPFFKTLDELKELAARYKRDAAARSRMAAAAKLRALSEHSWKRRAGDMAKWLLETL